MTCLRERAPVGERMVTKVPHGHWHTTTLVAALDRITPSDAAGYFDHCGYT